MHLLKSEYYDLPIKYDQTLIRLLVQSPTRMYAYWEVSEDTIKNFLKAIMKGYNYLVTADIEDIVDALRPSFDGTSDELIKKSNILDEMKGNEAIDTYNRMKKRYREVLLDKYPEYSKLKDRYHDK